MKSTITPSYRVKDFYKDFISNMKESELKKIYNTKEKILIQKEQNLKDNAKKSELNQCPHGLLPDDQLEIDDYKRLYEKFRKSKKTQSVREYLLNQISGNACVYCEKRSGNDTLDHVLPKSNYPYLTVSPLNLVSSCSTCNSKKGATITNLVHPYFDEFNSRKFVSCEIELVCLSSKYHIVTKFNFLSFGNTLEEQRLSQKLQTTFNELELANRYSEYCVPIINENILKWQKELKFRGTQSLVGRLKDDLNALKNQYSNNSCVVPFYESLINSLDNGNISSADFLKIESPTHI
ncbi:HNH endonuclease [Streptococcus equinus]|uniref:HNH endonuclease n=1 Tax=Streptococcus equinus TaxID=1335 RepID=UPI0008D5E492|nr:HNH endonuclease [Streptococcus equinus]UOC11447.1 HNH endonuclease [Streptococcus equinus]SEQ18371.1 5-methylcytosine-specific restriction endonuclease McrA [Streptococcus equinus]